MTDSLIHLRVPAALKGRWVRESRAAGMRLTDWITQRVDRPMPPTPITLSVPSGLSFSALGMRRDADGEVSFDWTAIERLCELNGLDVDRFRRSDEGAVGGLIVAWYKAHLAAGGERDPVQDDLIAEVEAEDRFGSSVSHAPGRA